MLKVLSSIWIIYCLTLPLMTSSQTCSTSLQDQNNIEKLSSSSLKFAFRLYKSVGDEDVFISPFSILVALAMLATGAGGQSLTQIYSTLQLNNFQNDENAINQAFLSLLNSICSNSNYTLSTANRIYLQNDFPILPAFVNTLQQYYLSTAKAVDFKSPTVAGEINSWVSQQTNGTIKDLFKNGSLDPSTILILLNAIYFKGIWLNKFKKQDTKPEDFTLSDGSKVKVEMMNIKSKFKYADIPQLDSQVLQLNYAGDRLVMYVILPNTYNGIANLRNGLTADSFNSLRQQLITREVIVKFPKFKMNFKKTLNDVLINLGIKDVFSPSAANLSKISDPLNVKLFVSDVIHQAFVSVDEEGTVAAAVTAISVVKTAAVSPIEPIEFIADRPFIFVIYDTKSNEILFIGNLNNP